MFQTFRNAWKIPELKNRLLFTLAILVVYRLGCAIPVPFVSGSALTQMFANGDMLSYLNMMSGGALARCTLFALGVTPYINASIIVQLLTVAIPALENLAKEADGQQKLQQINRYAGAVVALIMSIGYYFVIRNMGALKYVSGGAGIFAAIVIIATFVAGAQLITWCGEQIDDKGIGNGVSLIIFASIVSNWSSLYTSVKGLLTQAASGKPQYYFFLPLLIVLALVAVVFVVVMTNAERRITIQEVADAYDAGKLDEVFGTGTAAVVSPVGHLKWGDKVMEIGGGKIGPITQKLYDTMTGMQFGKIPDDMGWIEKL